MTEKAIFYKGFSGNPTIKKMGYSNPKIGYPEEKNMSNEEIKNVFNEVHNVFWVKWRDRVLDRESPDWKQFLQEGGKLMEKYNYSPLVTRIVAELIGEMSERMEAVERDARKKEK